MEATASIAPAVLGLKPAFFIAGIVTTPVDITLETAEPEIEPMKAEAITAIFAVAPRFSPASARAASVSTPAPPVITSSRPKTMNSTTTKAATCRAEPSVAAESTPMKRTMSSAGIGRPCSLPGTRSENSA